jgi:hypothetical protein
MAMGRFDPEAPVKCVICQRDVPGRLITLHPLKPKSRGGGADVRVPTCRTCHKQVHATFTNRELEQSFASLEALRSSERMEEFLAWVRKQKPDRAFRVSTSTARRRSRR